MKRLLTKILWGKQSKWQFALAGIGFLLGLLILLVSLQLYLDVQRVLDEKARNTADYLILNKDISFANTLGFANSTFSEVEIDSLRRQPFVKRLGEFNTSQFQATVETNQTIPFYTVLFFESVPDAFLDEIPGGWRWNEASEQLPIIVSQEFLNLYNFGFALSQGLPQLSRGTLKLLPLTVVISGPKGQRKYNARIVGFSDRIASVLVPDSFMRWANQHIGPDQTKPPSRLMVQVNDASNPAIADYLTRFSYQTNNDKLKASQTGRIIQVVMSLIGIVGIFFIVLSFIIFTSNFRVIIAEAKDEIALLLQLGYRVGTIARHLLVYFALFLAAVMLTTFILLQIAVARLQTFVQTQGIDLSSGVSATVIYTGLTFIALCLAVNTLSVMRLLRRNQH
ncbi:MAG: FtsX-like permease family protein [Bacteroidota bacterium]